MPSADGIFVAQIPLPLAWHCKARRPVQTAVCLFFLCFRAQLFPCLRAEPKLVRFQVRTANDERIHFAASSYKSLKRSAKHGPMPSADGTPREFFIGFFY